MTNDEMKPTVDDEPVPAEPEQVCQQAKQSQANAAAQQPIHRIAPGRRPLFRS